MNDIKHVGRIVTTGRKCIIVYRTLPGDAFNSLIVPTETLSESYHDALINLVDSTAGQNSNELSEVLARALFPDGSTMLPSLHAKGFLVKVPTSQVLVTPNPSVSILLSELNQVIAEKLGVSVQDLSIKPETPPSEVKEIASATDISPTTNNTDPKIDQVQTDLAPVDLAKKYRSDADRLSKEAAKLRRMAEEIVPTKKKAIVVE